MGARLKGGLFLYFMKYHFIKPSLWTAMYGEVYSCDHPVYNRCTLYKIGGRGLAVIQQRFNAKLKITWWDEVDKEITDVLYLTPGFLEYFNAHADYCRNDIYPTVTLRQIMWALRMRPLIKQRWETVFDRNDI